MDDTQINDAQGLSSLFITNLLVEIKDSLSIYSNNFTLQAERMLNNKFEQTFWFTSLIYLPIYSIYLNKNMIIPSQGDFHQSHGPLKFSGFDVFTS